MVRAILEGDKHERVIQSQSQRWEREGGLGRLSGGVGGVSASDGGAERLVWAAGHRGSCSSLGAGTKSSGCRQAPRVVEGVGREREREREARRVEGEGWGKRGREGQNELKEQGSRQRTKQAEKDTYSMTEIQHK